MSRVIRRAYPKCFKHLVVFGEAALIVFGEDDVVIEGYLEGAAAGGDEFQAFQTLFVFI